MPKNVGYAWTGSGLISRTKLKRTLPEEVKPNNVVPPGIASSLKVNRAADKNKKRGK